MSTSLYEKARRIADAALAAVRPARLVGAAVRRQGDRLDILGRSFDLRDFNAVDIVAFGKASPALSESVAALLEDRLRSGLAIGLRGQDFSLPRFAFLEAGHPFPDGGSEVAARAVLDRIGEAGPRDLLAVLISGGGSAMLCAPLPGITLQEKLWATRELMTCGADIGELNTVRKHLSAIKGGRLAAASAARIVNLIISDVPGDDPATIASGPTVGDASTFADAAAILRRYKLWQDAPPAVRETINKGEAGEIEETPKPGHEAFRRVSTFIIGRNANALAAARREAEILGFQAVVLGTGDSGEARLCARRAVSHFLTVARSYKPGDKPLALISGGEHTVTVRGRGQGGRNQEFVLAALVELERRARQAAGMSWTRPDFQKTGGLGKRDWLILSVGTDGIDGPTEAAGAWAGPPVLRKARSLGLNMAMRLEENDSHPFFRQTGGLIVTGPTGTNVMDVRVLLLAG